MTDAISQQYNEISNSFLQEANTGNNFSRNYFYSILDFDMKGKKLLDIGCGDGIDLQEYQRRNAIVYGLDTSSKMIAKATERIRDANLALAPMEKIPYPDNYFDIVLSKYALQISTDVKSVLNEIARVLKPGGILAMLVNHPLRQFLEKNHSGKDYFLQEIVETPIFDGKVVCYEPSHTFNEYLSPEFLSKFRLLRFEEQTDFPGSRRINGDNYPCFFIVKAQRFHKDVLRYGN